VYVVLPSYYQIKLRLDGLLLGRDELVNEKIKMNPIVILVKFTNKFQVPPLKVTMNPVVILAKFIILKNKMKKVI